MMYSGLDINHMDFLRGHVSAIVSPWQSELSTKMGVSSREGGGSKGRASDKGGMFEKLLDGGADECGMIKGSEMVIVDELGNEMLKPTDGWEGNHMVRIKETQGKP